MIYSYLKEGSLKEIFFAAAMLQSSAMRFEYPTSLSYQLKKLLVSHSFDSSTIEGGSSVHIHLHIDLHHVLINDLS